MNKIDLIDRKEVIDALWKLRRSLQMMDNSQDADRVLQGVFLSENAIEKVPSAERTAYLIRGENERRYCSNCKMIDNKYSVARYCWYCGAKYKGEKNDDCK